MGNSHQEKKQAQPWKVSILSGKHDIFFPQGLCHPYDGNPQYSGPRILHRTAAQYSLRAGFFVLGLVTFGADYFLVVGAVLGIVGHLAWSLAATPRMPGVFFQW